MCQAGQDERRRAPRRPPPLGQVGAHVVYMRTCFLAQQSECHSPDTTGYQRLQIRSSCSCAHPASAAGCPGRPEALSCTPPGLQTLVIPERPHLLPWPADTLHTEQLQLRASLPPLLVNLADLKPPAVHYLGVAFGLTDPLLGFWRRCGFRPVYLRQTPSDVTGGTSSATGKHWHADLAGTCLTDPLLCFRRRCSFASVICSRRPAMSRVGSALLFWP